MKRLFGFLMLATLAFAGCTNDEGVDFGNGSVSIEASIDQPGSRVGFNSTGAFFWTINDAIGVTTSGSTTDFSKMSIAAGDEGTATATFSAKYMSGQPEGYAVYPYNANHKMSGSTLTYNFPASYEYTIEDNDYFVLDGTGNSFNPPMWSAIEDGKVFFKHLGGVLCVKIFDLPAGDDQTLTVTTSNKITGTFTADLSASSPVLTTSASNTDNVVTINYSNAAEADRVFYIPVPAGVYESITVSFEAEGETVVVPFSNKTINARSLQRLQIGSASIEGGEAAASVAAANKALEQGASSVVISNIAADATDATIVIPEQATADNEVSIEIENIAFDGEIVIDEADGVSNPVAVLNLTLPEDAIDNLVINMPNTTVYVNGVIVNLTAITADNTLVVSEGSEITNLIIKGGNVFISAGATVQAAERADDNTDEVTYIYYEAGANVPAQVGEGIVLLSEAEMALREAIAVGGSYTLTEDVVLNNPLVIDTDFTLSLNGYTISQEKECNGTYAMITNKGKFTILGEGAITFEDLGAGPAGSSWGTYVIRNQGDLTISLADDAKIEHKGPRQFTAGNGDPIAYVIDNHSAGKVEINGGTISSPKSRTLRNFYTDGEIVINGGVFEGQVWIQQGNASGSGDHTTKIVELTINGGEFSPAGADGSSVFLTNHSADNVKLSVTGGTFNTKIGCNDANKAGVKGAIVGGIFTESAKANTNSALFAEGVDFVEAGTDLWEVVSMIEQTGENTYAVSTVEGLKWIANQVNTGKNYFEGKTIVLANDIDLNNVEWTPIGSMTQDHGFMGNFDGNNKTIKNLNITEIEPDADVAVYAGLFGLTEGSATKSNFVKNLTIENVNIESEGDIASALIAYAYYTEVENITVKGDINIKGRDYVSGILAYTRRCVVAKNLTIEGNAGSVIEGGTTVGGVISDIQMNGGLVADYSNFKAKGLTIKATKAVGGISGIISGQTLDGATVENVAIVCDNVHKGIVSGSLGEKSTISNLSYSNVTGATAVVGAVYKTANPVEARIGDVYYKTFVTDALANVKAGETITLQSNVTLSGSVVLNNEGTLDLGGFSISQKQAQSAAYNMIQNQGTWTIKNGTLDYADIAELTAAVNYVSNTIQNSGSLILEDVKVVNNSGSAVAANGYPHPIDNSGKLVINSGEFTNNADYSSMRIWCTTDTDTEVIINGGTFNGSIDFQNVSSQPNKGTLTINGGTFNADTYTKASVRLLGFGADVDEMNGYIKGGTFNGPLKLSKYVSGDFNSQVFFVSGGKFSVEPVGFYAEGYSATKEGDYFVVSK